MLFYRLQRLEDYFAIAFLFFFIFGYFIKETFYKGSITETSKGAVLKGGESRVPSHPVYEGGRGKCCELWRGGPPDGLWGVVSVRERVGKTAVTSLCHSLGLLLIPPISQTQPGARIQGIPGRGSIKITFFFKLSYVWLCWIFIAVCGHSLVAVYGLLIVVASLVARAHL